MNPIRDEWTSRDRTVRILVGNVTDRLRDLPDESVQCVVTSPPYWGLRDYGCEGQIGLEETPDAYVARMVEVFREVRRVLREDGTCWVNLGDSYASSPPGNTTKGVSGKSTLHGVNGESGQYRETLAAGTQTKRNTVVGGLKPKDLVGIPWMVAFALRADGWYLRQDIIWHKPNPMPESVTDRCTKAHEYLFLLTKSARYFYDAEAVKEEGTFQPGTRRRAFTSPRAQAMGREPSGNEIDGWVTESGFRNRRSVWTVATAPYPEAHFATYPPALITPCIQAGTSERGCCPHCGKPWGRVMEREPNGGWSAKYEAEQNTFQPRGGGVRGKRCDGADKPARVIGESWQPQCTCPDHEPIPCTVLDPFLGSGTTAQVARQLNRHAVGIELNPEYALLARKRSMQRLDGEDDVLPLFEQPNNGKRQRELISNPL